jgi:hypothetical protein
MSSSLDWHVAQPGQPEISLVNEIGGLQRVIRTLVAEQASSQASKFGVHDREQLLESVGITGIPPAEKLGDVTHMWRE